MAKQNLRRVRRGGRSPKGIPMKKIRVRSGKLVARVYPLLEQSVEEGVASGLRRSEKHADDPLTELQRDRVSECVRQAVLDAIMERFDVKGDERL